MEKKQAVYLADLIEVSKPAIYDIKKLETVNGKLPGFHQWTNGKQTTAAFEVTRIDSETTYYYLLIDWHRNDNYYLVIYLHNKSTTAAELRVIEEIDGIPYISWMYNPLKRDGKNDQRKAYFKQMFGSRKVHIKIPDTTLEITEFLNELFRLCQNRIKADKVVEVFNFEK
ncbi:hypothetical protein P9D43_10025 [Neobacillus niacini]|uniref:hypothetical protein n=1 Tax=Neobacillus niacini TaxID=86668 RepID=UPI00052F5182|nr:hypothetical protein [Neobacillus niacini]KGM44638.1 hypothetical protein NP83_10375 [Neobacillus niacini]MEC1522344.1 hypothetical protein [Neobacillus niacini]